MGFPMAGYLAKNGHEVTVSNRTPAKAEAWVAQHGGQTADTPKAAVQGASLVFSCVGDDPDLRAITLGPNGAFEGMTAGSIYVDHTTASANLARELFAAASLRGIHFIDAPVSGGQVGAENGTLTVMCGGEPGPFETARLLIAHYARAVRLLGPAGAGQLTKMVNQICIAGLLQGLAEGIAFGLKAGLEMKQVLEVIGKGAAQSWQMDNRGLTMVEDRFDFGFAVDWMRKDLRICLEEAKKIDATLPVTEMVNGYYGEVQNMGGGRWDTSSLIRRLVSSGVTH
jgi:3-hydroxyisobutyrate dehydrogenase-like beta-hydroxyacid dehydrogenase